MTFTNAATREAAGHIEAVADRLHRLDRRKAKSYMALIPITGLPAAHSCARRLCLFPGFVEALRWEGQPPTCGAGEVSHGTYRGCQHPDQ